MNIDHLPIIQAVEDAAGCPLADLPDDSEWWAVYEELINELNEETMTEQVKKLIDSAKVYSLPAPIRYEGLCKEVVLKSDLERIVEELTMWHKAEDCLPNEGETVICKTLYTLGKREVYRYEVSDFINSRYWCENNQYVKVLEWKRIL